MCLEESRTLHGRSQPAINPILMQMPTTTASAATPAHMPYRKEPRQQKNNVQCRRLISCPKVPNPEAATAAANTCQMKGCMGAAGAAPIHPYTSSTQPAVMQPAPLLAPVVRRLPWGPTTSTSNTTTTRPQHTNMQLACIHAAADKRYRARSRPHTCSKHSKWGVGDVGCSALTPRE